MELVDEVAAKENTTQGKILSRADIGHILSAPDMPHKYEEIHKILSKLRYPVLSEMRKQIARALDQMELDDKTKLRFQDTFESNELKLELKFQSEKELSRQVETIFKALQSGSVEKLIAVFKNIE